MGRIGLMAICSALLVAATAGAAMFVTVEIAGSGRSRPAPVWLLLAFVGTFAHAGLLGWANRTGNPALKDFLAANLFWLFGACFLAPVVTAPVTLLMWWLAAARQLGVLQHIRATRSDSAAAAQPIRVGRGVTIAAFIIAAALLGVLGYCYIQKAARRESLPVEVEGSH